MSQDFVGRESELARLHTVLQKALTGETQVCFITGEAGTGKSSLIEEFVRQSEHLDETLLFTRGNCNAQTGICDPYLPFRNILRMLTGDSANAITSNNAQRLNTILRTSGRVLVEIAPELVGSLIPGAGILVALARMGAKEKGLLKSLEERAAASEKHKTDIDQSQIFSQYTALLRDLSKDYPLVIILDDLQWVDAASNALLFNLVRELKTCRILFVGLYRPNDVAVGRNNERHPLEQTLNEIKRIHGDVWIDLDAATEQNGRAFVDALLNSQPNTLSPTFRSRLLKRTRGHALFTTELLLAMQERGDLIQDADGRWQESPQLDWNTLPARVEAIIEERIERLEDDLRDILDVACVEGQDFTAQVVAKIQEIKERDLIKTLSRELEKCHRLVQDTGEIKLGKTKLWRYTFSHALFQVYLYNSLETPERCMYHTDVANALEELYAGQTETIAVQLAYHYTEAGEPEKAVPYLQQAGEQACKFGEFNSARNFFTQALATIESEDLEQLNINRAHLFWWIGETYYYTSRWDIAESQYRQSVDIARQLGSEDAIACGLIGLAQSLRRQRASEEALQAVQEALSIARRTANRRQECSALRVVGIIYGQMDQTEERFSCYELALKIAAEIGAYIEQMDCLNSLGVLYGEVFGNYIKNLEYCEHAMKLAAQYGCIKEQALYMSNLTAYRRVGNYEKTEYYASRTLEIRHKLGKFSSTAYSHQVFGILHLHKGNSDLAIKAFLKGVQITNQYPSIVVLVLQVEIYTWLSIAYLIRDQHEDAQSTMEKAKPLLDKFKVKSQVYSEGLLEATIYLRIGQLERARQLFESAMMEATRLLSSKRWAVRYHRAFAQAGTALLVLVELRAEHLNQATELFRDAVETCGWVGILDDALLILREMQKADSSDLLKPIEAYLVKKRETAWKNRPFSD